MIFAMSRMVLFFLSTTLFFLGGGGSWNCQRAPNFIYFIKLYEFFGSEPSTSIKSHDFNLVSNFFFHYSFKLLENFKNF